MHANITGYQKIKTFTDEVILFKEEYHSYKDLDGNKLISGSQYKKQFEEPFPKEIIIPKVAKKYGVSENIIDEMWTANGKLSAAFGTVLHLAMENYFKYREHGCLEKQYHIAKHPFLKEAITSFPLKDENAIPEVLISDVKNFRVGRIDLLTIAGEMEAHIEDYKSDTNISKNLSVHFHQLSFYAHILMAHGWKIKSLRLWNYAGNGWEMYESKVLDLVIHS